MNGVLLVIDLGTQSLRAAAIDRGGNKLAVWSRPVETRRQGPVCEQDPGEWRRGVERILADFGRDRALAARLEGAIASGVLSTAVPLDPGGNPLRPAMLYSDARPAALIQEIEATAAFERVRQRTGWRAYSGDMLPQTLYLAREEAAVYRRSASILDATGYLNFLLTGRATMDNYTRLTCYGDPRGGGLPGELLRELGLDGRKLGEPVPVGHAIGPLSPRWCESCGLPPCPVISAPYDSMAAYLGAGLESGEALDISGTVTSFGVLHGQQVIDPERRIYSVPYRNGGWLVRGSTAMSGGALEWARQCLVRGTFEEFDRLVDESPPGARGLLFLPYLAGERSPLWNPDARGVFFGLSAETSLADMARAVYEGVCLSLRHIQSVIEGQGVRIRRVLLAGGLSRNDLLNRLKADITGKRLAPLEDFELTTAGAAAIAGRALGWYASPEEARAVLLRPRETLEPDARREALYAEQFRRYVDLVQCVAPAFGKGQPSTAEPDLVRQG